MFYVGFDVLRDTVQKDPQQGNHCIDPLGASVGVGSALVMLAVYLYNLRTLAKTSQIQGPKGSRQRQSV